MDVHSNEVYGSASPGQVKLAMQSYSFRTDKNVFPPYWVTQVLHLSDYISDFQSFVNPLVGKRAQRTLTSNGEMGLADILLDGCNPSHAVENLIGYKKGWTT